MSNSIDVAITLRLKDQAAAPAARVLEDFKRRLGGAASGNREVARSAAEVEHAVGKEARAYDRVGKSQDAVIRRARQLGETARRAAAESQRGAERMTAAWTKAAGAAKGAAGAMRMAGRGMGAAGQMGAGVMAGGYVMQRALDKPIDFERRMADMANTAFSDRDLAGRQAGMLELREAVNAAVNVGGGSRDSAAEALNALIASGKVGADAAMAMLPTLQKFGAATGASPLELANIAISGLQNEFFKPEEITEALDKALVAGQSGNFELRDMARWLPQLMASARGMSGMAGFETILAAAQASMATAGGADQAGNNLVNLLAKMTSQDAAKDFEKLGIDLTGSLAAAVEKGMNPLDAFVALIDKEVVGKDKAYAALQAQLAAAGGDGEKTAVMENMADILEGGALGQVIQDRQALMALIAVMNQRGSMAEIREKFASSAGAGEANLALIASTSSFQRERAASAVEKAQDGLLESVKGPLDAALAGIADFSEAFPGLTTGVYAAGTAIAAMTAGAAAFAGLGLLGGGATALAGGSGAALAGGGGGALAGSGAALAGGGGGALAGSGAALAGGGWSALLGPLAAAAGLSYFTWTAAEDMEARGARPRGRGAGMWPRQGDGPAVPGGGRREAVIDPAVAGLAAEARRILSETPAPVSITNQLVLDGAVIAQKVNEINAREMARR